MTKRKRGTDRERRVLRVLDAMGLNDVSDLIVFKESELRCLPRVGTVTVDEIRQQLEARGLTLLETGSHRPLPDAIRAVFRRGDRCRQNG